MLERHWLERSPSNKLSMKSSRDFLSVFPTSGPDNLRTIKILGGLHLSPIKLPGSCDSFIFGFGN